MTRPVRPEPLADGPRMPASVLRRRPAEVLDLSLSPPPPRSTAPAKPTASPPPPRRARSTAQAQPTASPPPRGPRSTGSAQPTASPPPRGQRSTASARPAAFATSPNSARRSGLGLTFRRRPDRPPGPIRGRRPVPFGLLAAALVFVGLFCVGMGLGNATGFDLSGLFRGPDKPPPLAFPVLEPSRPVRLTIPSIKVTAPILLVGLAKDGSVDVPPLNRHNEAGWFDAGPTPGQFGPALIVGHADTHTGPSVFHDLGKMKPGQRIEVQRRDNSIAVFQVNSVEHFGKSKLPIQRVYGDYSRPSLRLMTCGGTWLGGTRGYSDNVIVFASLISSKNT